MADSVTAELAWIQTLVESARQLAPADLDLEDTSAPVIVAERLLGARIHLDVTGTSAFADRVALIRVVQNVLANARHYAPQSPVEVTATRATVFERGARGSSSAGTPGNGLGLYAAQSLLEAMGGTIALNDGSPVCRFVITLPRASDGSRFIEDTWAASGAGGSPGQPDHLARAV